MRGLNRAQVNHVIDLLANEKHKEKNYYSLRKAFVVKVILT